MNAPPDRRAAGVDEAGRGPLAGPVFAAAVILDRHRRIRGLDDSKRLSEPVREELAEIIKARALAWAVGFASVEEIDRLNIFHASLLAMRRAVEHLPMPPDEILVDGLHCPAVGCASRAIVDGDAKIPAISAASILAKTSRDAEMRALHERFPQYGFARHKGYATAEHLDLLRRHGACEAYRRTFAPVREVLGLPPLPPPRLRRPGDEGQGALF